MTMQTVCADDLVNETRSLKIKPVNSAPLKSALATWLARIAEYFEAREQRRIDRDAFKTMLTLDDEMLADIGVTRDDIRWASKLPLSVNASKALEEAKRFGHG